MRYVVIERNAALGSAHIVGPVHPDYESAERAAIERMPDPDGVRAFVSVSVRPEHGLSRDETLVRKGRA